DQDESLSLFLLFQQATLRHQHHHFRAKFCGELVLIQKRPTILKRLTTWLKLRQWTATTSILHGVFFSPLTQFQLSPSPEANYQGCKTWADGKAMKRTVLLKDGVWKETIELSKSFSTISTKCTFSTDILLGLVKFRIECIKWTSYILQTQKQTSSVLRQRLCFKSILRSQRVINQIEGAQAIVEETA
ncbi:hypothetical protein O181_090619, partial [Austropuccinia psidii MF-1]|nr:hypothetical protein [Austropuccinia psidii MF-1]